MQWLKDQDQNVRGEGGGETLVQEVWAGSGGIRTRKLALGFALGYLRVKGCFDA